jgi:hypothetical protein
MKPQSITLCYCIRLQTADKVSVEELDLPEDGDITTAAVAAAVLPGGQRLVQDDLLSLPAKRLIKSRTETIDGQVGRRIRCMVLALVFVRLSGALFIALMVVGQMQDRVMCTPDYETAQIAVLHVHVSWFAVLHACHVCAAVRPSSIHIKNRSSATCNTHLLAGGAAPCDSL